MSVRIGTLAILGCAALSLAACSSHSGGTGGLGAAPAPASAPAMSPSAAVAPSGAATTSSAKPPKPAVTVTVTKTATGSGSSPAVLTCAQLKTAFVGSATISYHGYHDSIPLGGGVWSGEDGTTVTLLPPCAIGDLTGDGIREAVGVVVATNGGTGQFYTLVVWRNLHGHPVFTALADLSDRNPVQSIAIAGGKATVVYLTRTADAPMAELNIKRTAVFRLSGHAFTEQSHSDQPYSPT